MATAKTFRNSAAFGKRMEYFIVGRMLKEGLDVYMPLVDDHAVDAIVKRGNGTMALVQIKARSADVLDGHGALFAGIPHEEIRPNYWFVFYSERMDKTWLMTSEEFKNEARQNLNGKHKGKYTLLFNGRRTDKSTGSIHEHCKLQYEKYLAPTFDRLAHATAVPASST